MADAKSEDQNVNVTNAAGKSGILFVCEHASNFIPEEYANLGLDETALNSHAAWDPGALAVATHLSALLDAPLVASTVSRLVYDCNRPLAAESAIPEKSEIYDVPGNKGLTEAARLKRFERFHNPFHQAIEDELERSPLATAYISVHSFTPIYYGKRREHELGILHDTDSRLADELLLAIAEAGDMEARRNYPYGPQDGVTYTINQHATPRQLPTAMFEIRNDLIADDKQQRDMAVKLTKYIQQALSNISDDQKRAVSS